MNFERQQKKNNFMNDENGQNLSVMSTERNRFLLGLYRLDHFNWLLYKLGNGSGFPLTQTIS